MKNRAILRWLAYQRHGSPVRFFFAGLKDSTRLLPRISNSFIIQRMGGSKKIMGAHVPCVGRDGSTSAGRDRKDRTGPVGHSRRAEDRSPHALRGPGEPIVLTSIASHLLDSSN